MTMSIAGVPFALTGRATLTHFVTMLESKWVDRRRYGRLVRGRERAPWLPDGVKYGE